MRKLKLKYYIEFSELVDEEAITNMTEEEVAKFKKQTEEYFFKILQPKTKILVTRDLKVKFDVEEVS